MPVYNAEAHLNEAIDSVLKQTHQSFEFLIIDDGSTDTSRDIVQSYADSRIKLLCNPHDYIATLNSGLENASGDYIFRFDADDVMLPHRLSLQYNFMESNPEVDICGSYIALFGDLNQSITWYPLNHQDITNSLSIRCPLANSSTCIRKCFLERNNIRYSDEYIYCEDYKLWTDIAMAKGVFANIPEILTQYRCHSGQISNIHHAEQYNGAMLIKQEITNWFLKQIKESHPIGKNIINNFIPSLNELNLYNILSPATYNQILYEIICNMRSRKAIEI